MTLIAKIISYLGLGLTLIPSILLLSKGEGIRYQILAVIGMVLWFVSAPFWVNKTKEEEMG